MSASVFQSSSFSQMGRLLRASSTTRRRPVSIDSQARGRVSRSLFGPVDHEATRRFVAAELADISSRDQLRWGFNFQMEKPLEGNNKQRYAWQRVPANDHQVPEAYRLPYLDTVDTSEEDTPQPTGLNLTETAAPTTKSVAAAARKTRKTRRRTSVGNHNLRQLKITDFTKVQRKRSFDEILEEKSSKISSSSSSNSSSLCSRLEKPIKQARAS